MMRCRQILIFFAVMAAVLVSTGCVSYVHSFLTAAEYPEIRPQPGATFLEVPGYTFDFKDFQVGLSSPVDPEVYAGARSAEKQVRIYDTSMDDDEWRSGLYRIMTMDPAQNSFYNNLTDEFRETRAVHDLDSDEYLELMTVFVQSLPYHNQNISSPKYPIETYHDREGDCDDKSMLLAGLLAHEGYSVALFYFGPEQHMAVGVACPETGYRDTGYAYIETTRVSLVGTIPGSLSGNITLVSNPLVIPIGDGIYRYSRCNETAAINAELTGIAEHLKLLRVDLSGLESALISGRSDLETMELVMEQMHAGGDRTGYNRLVPEYNNKVRDYNRDLEEYKERSEEYARLAERYNYIIEHEHDRAGISRYLFGTKD
jgi:hypothetical protein